MGIFKPTDPEAALRKVIDSERTLRDQLRLQRTTAETLAGEHQKAARKLLHDLADDVLIDKAEQKQITAEHRVANLSVTLSEADAKITDLENQLKTVIKDKLQAEASKVKDQHSSDLGTAGADLDRALQAMTDLAGKISSYCLDARGVHVFCGSAREELSAAVSMLRTILEASSFPPELVLRQPAPPPQALPQPAPQVAVFTDKKIRWIGADGTRCTMNRWHETSLPTALADRAIRIGACVPAGHDLHRSQKGWGKNPINPAWEACDIDLDNPDVPIDAAPNVHPLQLPDKHVAFERIDRGPGFNLKVPRNEAVPASATRELPKDE
jgi:hypothetical protein